MKTTDIVPGKRYFLSGDIANGRNVDGSLRTSHEEVSRKVLKVTSSHVICECGRKFIINDNLVIKNIITYD